MLLPLHNKQATPTASSTSLLSLVPRSVVLAKLSMTTAAASNGCTVASKKLLLLQSVYRYLKTNGFSKTVKKLMSEAELNEDEFADTLVLDLEEICSEHLEAHLKSDQELKSNGKTKEKKKSKKSSDASDQAEKAEDDASKAEIETDTEVNKKKKKHKKVTNENDEKNASDAASSEKLQKSKKKKKQDSNKEDAPLKTSESKKRKRVSTDDDCHKTDDATADDKSKEMGAEEPVSKKSDSKFDDVNRVNELTNSNNGDKSSGRKSAKKSRNGSAEPTTVKAFQRVKVDEVVIKDERLKDNSYWAKDGAESGYGAKAQEILGQVRGKDFRHEKTKKKRGSYRGGQIDFDSHSIKFNDSDEE